MANSLFTKILPYIRGIAFVLIGFLSVVALPTWAQSVQNVTITTTIDADSVRTRESMITNILSSSVWRPFTSQASTILIDSSLIEPRGRMKGRTISLSASVARDSEFLQLFTHEFAHFIDIYLLQSTGRSDPSAGFYTISWTAPDTKRAGQKATHFVSGYAATNQYEDFAESLVFYVFHNRAFLERAMRDETLRSKYLFFQSTVFPSGVFVDTDFSLGRVPSYFWDTTKLPISLQKYLYFLSSSI